MTEIGASYIDGRETWISIDAFLSIGLDNISYQNVSDSALQSIVEYQLNVLQETRSFNSFFGSMIEVGRELAFPSTIEDLKSPSVFGVVAGSSLVFIGGQGWVLTSDAIRSEQEVLNRAQSELLHRLNDEGRTYLFRIDPNAAARNYDGKPGNDYFGDLLDAYGHRLDNPISVGRLLSEGEAATNWCFPRGTSIRLLNGAGRVIEDLRVGDAVAAFDGSANGGRDPLVSGRIVRLFNNITDTWPQAGCLAPTFPTSSPSSSV